MTVWEVSAVRVAVEIAFLVGASVIFVVLVASVVVQGSMAACSEGVEIARVVAMLYQRGAAGVVVG